MANRAYKNFTGDRGEYRAIAQLLETGAAINSLTSADTGWDLHLHLPEEPLAFLDNMQLSRATKGWKLSGRIAHVQVKSMELSSYPSLARGTVNGWIAGSTYGVPTFVLLLKAEDDIEFVDIADLVLFITQSDADAQAWKSGTEVGPVKLGKVRRRRFDPVNFSAIAHLYLTYPVLMSTVGSMVNDVLWSTPRTEEGSRALRKLVVALVDGHASETLAHAIGVGFTDDRYEFLGKVTSSLCKDSDWLDLNRDKILTDLAEPDSAEGISPKLYASVGSPGEDDDLSKFLTLIVRVSAKLASNSRSPRVNPAEFDDLNRRFYSQPGPEEYFDNRYNALMRHIGRKLPTDDATHEQGEPSVTEGPDNYSEDASEAAAKRDRFASLDATVLLHHAAETFTRLYLAHADRNPCPWVALTEMKQKGVFARKLRSLRERLQGQDKDLLDDLTEVFTRAGPSEPVGGTAAKQSWAGHREALAILLEFCVIHLLDDSNLYNAAKHGFGVSAHDGAMVLGDSKTEDDPYISFLDFNPREELPWTLVKTWVDPGRYLAVVLLISQQLGNLWKCASDHHSKDEVVGGDLDPEVVRQAIEDPALEVDTFSISTELRLDEDDQPPSPVGIYQ